MYISSRELYQEAVSKEVALGAFNTNNLEVTQAIIAGAESVGVPCIVQTTPKAIEYAGLSELFALIKSAIDDSSVPVTIHLDHATEIDLVKKCLEKGYRSVMFDGSKLPFAENVAMTKKVVDLAHKFDAFVEGEIGQISKGEEGTENSGGSLTDPEEAAEFVKLTGVNSLAVSIGNIHGAPEGEKLNIELLNLIYQKIDVPLVLHGASGLSRNYIIAAIENGVRKINIDTQIRRAFKKSLKENIDDQNKDIRDFLTDAREDVEKVIIKYLKLFNNLD